VVKACQALCGLNVSNTIFRILESTAVPSSESVDQFQLVQRAAAIKEASVAVAAEDGNAHKETGVGKAVPQQAANRRPDGATVGSVSFVQCGTSRTDRGVSNPSQTHQLLRPGRTTNGDSKNG
jgi:hypothetical protein